VRDVRDETTTLLYVEGRIAFVDQPHIRLFTRWDPRRGAAMLHAEGTWLGRHGAQPLESCNVAVWAELICEHGRKGAWMAARELYAAIQAEYLSSHSWGRVHV
jgi:hypothetical protein